MQEKNTDNSERKKKTTTVRHTNTYTGIHTFRYIGETKQSEKNDIYIAI